MGVIKIGWNGNDCTCYGFTQIPRCFFREFPQHHGGDFFRGKITIQSRTLDFNIAIFVPAHGIGHLLVFGREFRMFATDEALDIVKRVLRIQYGLTTGKLTHQTIAVLAHAHHRRRCAHSFRIGNDNRSAPFHDGDNRICGAQVDPYDSSHCVRYSRTVNDRDLIWSKAIFDLRQSNSIVSCQLEVTPFCQEFVDSLGRFIGLMLSTYLFNRQSGGLQIPKKVTDRPHSF